MSKLLNVAATGNVGPAGGCKLGSVSLAGGSAASTATLREGGASGTVIAQLTSAITVQSSLSASDPAGIDITGQLHVTLGGTGASINIELL